MAHPAWGRRSIEALLAEDKRAPVWIPLQDSNGDLSGHVCVRIDPEIFVHGESTPGHAVEQQCLCLGDAACHVVRFAAANDDCDDFVPGFANSLPS